MGAEAYEKAHRRKRIWYRVIGVLAAVTVFFTTYALVLPAITMEPSSGIMLDRDFVYETDELRIDFHVEGRAAFTNEDQAPDDPVADKVQLSVISLKEGTAAYEAYADYADTNIGKDDLHKLLAIRCTFSYEWSTLDMSQCQITAEVTPKGSLLAPEEGETLAQDLFDEASAIGLRERDAQVVKAMSALGTEGSAEEQVLAFSSIQGVNTEMADQVTVFLDEGEQTSRIVTALSGDTMAFALYSTTNPTYTVQYYAHNTVLDDSGDIAIDVIDTSGGKLPTNTTNLPTVPAYLNHAGNGEYVLATHLELAPLYTEKSYQYVSAPGLAYVNRLLENGNYALGQVWVLKDGAKADSVKESDWNIYPATVSFTNRESSASASRIYIEDGTVIRLVYNEQDGSYTNDADFYDYDITDGDIHNANGSAYVTSYQDKGTWYAQTYVQGINNFTAASGTVKFSFGNVNTNTGLGNLTWNGNKLNMYNSGSFEGCTFGLVTGMNADGTLIFADGISAPKLFGSASAKGKTYLDDYSLQFSRSGDTYTLTAVNGTSTKDLNYFNNPSYTLNGSTTTYSHIYTNNFWPMDSAYTWGSNGHDLVFGSAALWSNRKYFKNSSTFYSSSGNFPMSDDGLDHNSYFGMHYEVSFTLTEDYLGPLEYMFYGDDDMWVFLDGKLICDIGGVHSSVGQYVNLWDYINKMSASEKYAQHTLSFYYTERGASGSTCFMQFTLPSVSIDTPQLETATLELEKQVSNAETDQKFEFTIELTDANGNILPDDYSYILCAADGTILSNGILNSDDNNVSLAHGEYLSINYLPKGTKYRITETAADGFLAVYKIDGGVSVEGESASGTLDGDSRVLFINSTGRALPSTGGTGLLVYTLPLLAAVAYLFAFPFILRRAKRHGRNIKK